MASSETNTLADRVSGLNVNAPTSPVKPAPQQEALEKENQSPSVGTNDKTESENEAKANVEKDADDAGGDTLGTGDDTLGTGDDTLGTGDLAVELNTTLARLQDDENSPLFSVKHFPELGLRHELLQALSLIDYRKPSKIQEKALPLLMHNPPMNLIAQAPSGTGKTAAFVLNMLSRLELDGDMKDIPQGLVLAPTRELASQLFKVVETIGQRMPELKVNLSIPDTGRTLQLGAPQITSTGTLHASVVVGTPGTIINRIKRRQLRVDKLKVLVLDEADKMLSQDGSGDDCTRIRGMLPSKMQFVLFSATMADHVREYANKFAPEANYLSLANSAAELLPNTITQTFLDCDNAKEKCEALGKLYSLLTISSSIIFVRTRQAAKELEEQLTSKGHVVARLTGELEGGERDAVLNKFRNLEAKVLIATDVLSRGIDISTVNMVINYDVPEISPPGSNKRYPDYDTYLHRIGRTGRFGKIGIAVSFVASRDDFLLLDDISKRYGTELIHLESSDWDGVEKSLKAILKSQRASASFK